MAMSLDDNAAAEDKFAYTASEIFSIVSPYVFHTHAPRVFSEISEALQRAQDASAEVMARLEASETAQEEERRMRAAEARGYVSRLRELQALMKARVEREIEGAKVRKSLKRKLEQERERSAQLEQGLADAEDKQRRLRRKFASEKKALEQWWRSTLDQAVLAARETERSMASSKVEGAMVKRLRSLSTEVSKLKEKLEVLQEENATYAEVLRARTPPPSCEPLKGHGEGLPRSESFRRRAKSEISRLSASAAAAAATDERSTASSVENSPRSKVSSTLSEFITGISERGLDLAVRLRKSISEHASGLGFSPRVSRRRRFFSGEDEEDEEEEEDINNGGGSAGFDVDFSWHPGHFAEPSDTPTQTQQTCAIAMPGEGAAAFAEGTVSAAATPTAVASSTGRYRLDEQETAAPAPPPPPPPLTVVSPTAGVDTYAPPVAEGGTHTGSKRRGLGPFRSPFRGAVVADAPSPNTPGADRTAVDPVRNSGGGDLFVKSPAGTTATLSSRRRHQRSLGGGVAVGSSNDPSLHALLASGEFFRSTGGRVEGAGGSSNVKPSRVSGQGLERERAPTCGQTQQAEGTTPPEHDLRAEPRRLDRGNDTNPTTIAGPPPVGGAVENQPVRGAPSSFDRGGSGVGRGDLSGGLEEGVDHQERAFGNLEGEGIRCGAQPSSCADPAAAVVVVAGGCVHGGAGRAAAAADVVVACVEEAHISADFVKEDGLAGARRDEGVRHDRHHPTDITTSIVGGSGGRTSRSGSSAGACDARGEGETGGVVDHHAGGGSGDRSPRKREGLPKRSTAGPASAPLPEEDCLLFSTTAAVSSNPDMGPRRRKRLDDLFPPKDMSVGDTATAAAEAAAVVPRTGDGAAAVADKGTQRLPLDDLLRDIWAVSSAEGPGEGDDAGGSVASSSAAGRKVQGERAGGAVGEEEDEGLSS